MTITNILLGAVLIGIGSILFFVQRRGAAEATDVQPLREEAAKLKAELEQKTGELGKMQSLIEEEKKQRSELAGKNKQLFAEQTKLEARYESLAMEAEKLKKKVTTADIERDQREKEFNDRISKLEESRHALDDEKQRIRQEDIEHKQELEEARDRLWADHEMNVIAKLTELCKQPQYAFTHYSNTNLPDEFDGSLKPDFMIEFLGQYVIFDAKVSKAKSLQTYINDTVKSTVLKVKKNPKIFTTIFLVVPTEAAAELKTHYYPHDGYTLFVVSPEALAPILSCYKRITSYELAEGLDPQDRENIVNIIAEMDFHINVRNAADLILAKMGTNMIEKVQKLKPDLAKEVNVKKQEMKIPNFNTSDLKKLAGSVAAQAEAMQELATPKATVQQKDLDTAKSSVIDALF